MTQPSLIPDRTIVVVDIVGFTSPDRNPYDRLGARQGLYLVLETAFSDSGVDFDACAFEDRGDGALILLPPETSKTVVADRLPERIAVALRRYNHTRTPRAQIRLRMSLNSGDLRNEGNTWVGEAIDTAFRILDAQAANEAFADSSLLLAVIASQLFFDEVIAPDPGLLPESYTAVPVSVKSFTGTAYFRLHGERATATSLPTSTSPDLPVDALTKDVRPAYLVHSPDLDMMPSEDLTVLRLHLAPLDVPHLAVMMSRALGPATPLPDLAGITDAWSAFHLLTDFNAGPDGIPPAITFLWLLADHLGGEVGAVITSWVRDQAPSLRPVRMPTRPPSARPQPTSRQPDRMPPRPPSARPEPTFHLEFHSEDLDETLGYKGPDLATLFEPLPPDDRTLDTQRHDSSEFPISIYLSTAADHELVQAAVEDLVRAAGAEILERAEPKIGSWMRRLIGRMKVATQTPGGRDVATTAAHAVEARMVQAQDATNTATLMQNLAPMLTALQNTPSAVIRVGALLIVKNGDTLAVHQLTATQQFHLNHKPDLLTSPHDILHALDLHTSENTAITADAARPDTSPVPHLITPVHADSEPMNNSVGPAWQRITAWLRTNTPATATTLRPPAPAADIHATEHAIGRMLPDDLIEWWRLTDGVDDKRDHRTAFTVPRIYIPLPVASVRLAWASLSTRPEENCCHTEGRHHLQPAGEPTARYCTALIPICRALDGAILAVDLRPGTEHGHVMDWTDWTGARRTSWPSVSALLTDIASRLENHKPTNTDSAQPGQPIVRDDGALTWA